MSRSQRRGPRRHGGREVGERLLPRPHPLRAWWGSWRISLRVAAREARRSKGISALIMIMVGLPVAVVTGGAAVLATTDVSPAESADWILGSSQALVSVAAGTPVQQTPDASNYSGHSDGAEVPVWTEEQMSRAVGGRAHETTSGQVVLDENGRDLHTDVEVMSPAGWLDTRSDALVTGRWPSEQGEVVVSADLAARGLAPGDLLGLRPSGDESPADYRIVGVAESHQANGTPFGVMASDRSLAPRTPNGDVLAGDAQTFLLTRPDPVGWKQITDELNQQGMVVLSREVILHSESVGNVPGFTDHWDPDTYYRSSGEGILLAGILAAILLETMLLAGPAFSISAARRSHSLALLSVNGASRRHLRRHTLAQGLTLGVAAAALGAGLGIGGFALLRAILALGSVDLFGHGPFQINPLVTIITAASASLAAMIAAMIPARGAARLDVSRALGDRRPNSTTRTRHPGAVVSVGLGLASLAVCGWGLLGTPSNVGVWLVALGAVVAILAGVGAVPLTLRVAGRLRVGPVAARLALRDAARQRARTLPALAAVVASTATMTLLLVVVESNNQLDKSQYLPQAPYGQLILAAGEEGSREEVLAEVESQHPEWKLASIETLIDDGAGDSGDPITVAVVVPPGCTAAEVAQVWSDSENPCSALGPLGTGAIAAPPEAIPEAAAAPDTLALLNSAGVAVSDSELITKGTITLAVARVSPEGRTTVLRTLALPAISDPVVARFDPYRPSAWMLAATAQQHQLATSERTLLARDPQGPISQHAADALSERVSTDVALEQGYVSPDRGTELVVLGAGLMLTLIGTLIATTLTRAEARADLATLHAVGATRSTVRLVSAWSAGLICALGSAQGILTGLMTGAALSRQQIGSRSGPTGLTRLWSVPGGDLGIGVLAVITLAAAMAWMTTRPNLQPIRRVG